MHVSCTVTATAVPAIASKLKQFLKDPLIFTSTINCPKYTLLFISAISRKLEGQADHLVWIIETLIILQTRCPHFLLGETGFALLVITFMHAFSSCESPASTLIIFPAHVVNIIMRVI